MGSSYENLVDRLEDIATRQPNNLALQAPGRSPLTYSELGEQIRYVRRRLSRWGIASGDIIAGAIPSRPEMALACATFPSSSTFAPLDPTLPAEVYFQLLDRLHPTAVLAPKGHDHPIRAAARKHGIAEIDLTDDPQAPAGMFTLELGAPGIPAGRKPVVAANVAFIEASSGTTGRPKLVPAKHRQLLLGAQTFKNWFRVSPNDVGCLITPIHHANGLRSGLLNPLLAGASVVCLPNGDIEAFFDAMERFQLTFLSAGFTVHRAILRRAAEFREVLKKSRIRFVRAGSGRLEPEEVEALEQVFGAPVLTALSTSETNVISADPLPPSQRRRGSVGLPLSNEVAILHEDGRISKESGTGEIVVRGPLVFSGYLDDPELTASSFAGDWFRTGDLGRIDDDGYIYISGRLKEIINRGGVKISPAEIDAAIESMPGVKEAATFGSPHPSLGEEVVAAVVAQANSGIGEAQIIEHVRERLGQTKTPRKIYFVDKLPRTASGKVRRKELPDLLGLKPSAAQDPRPAAPSAPAPAVPCSPLEGALAGLWASLLHVERVDRTDDFFLRGGDSLRGAQLLSQVKALFGVQISIQSLFAEAATVAGMAEKIEALRKVPVRK